MKAIKILFISFSIFYIMSSSYMFIDVDNLPRCSTLTAALGQIGRDLYSHVSTTASASGHRIISISEADQPRFLVIKKGLAYGTKEPAPRKENFSNYQGRIQIIAGNFRWKPGLGFTFSKKPIPIGSPIARDDSEQQAFLDILVSYLQFLAEINRALDDDLILNLSFYLVRP